MEKYIEGKERGLSKRAFLEEIAGDTGVYVPSLYAVTYHEEDVYKRQGLHRIFVHSGGFYHKKYCKIVSI